MRAIVPRARVLLGMLLCLAASWGVLEYRDWVVPLWGHQVVAPGSIAVDGDRGYKAGPIFLTFGDARVTLEEGRIEKREPIGLRQELGWSRVRYYLNGLIGPKYPSTTTAVVWQDVSVVDLLNEARNPKRARPSMSDGTLNFNATDGSDPRVNSRLYRIEVAPRLPHLLRTALKLMTLVLGAVLALIAAVAIFKRSRLVREHTPGIAIAAGLVLVAFGAGEIYLRLTVPFLENVWPGYVHPVAGFILKPNEELRHSNHADFWVIEKSNSLGFLDREPVIPKPPGTFRILVLGDSFVEAAQVHIDKKFHVLLEQRLRKENPGKAIDVVAMGYSGTGQAAQLAFYELYGKRLQPDLVINLFVSNDYANNSPVLESIRHGWHPYHAPRLFFDVDGAAPKFRRIGVDMSWDKHLIQVSTGNVDKDYSMRLETLRRDPAFAKLLDGWNPPNDMDMDRMFCAVEMPLAWRQAEEITGHVLEELVETGKRDGFRTLVVATDEITNLCYDNTKPRLTRRTALIDRLKRDTARAGIEVFDLYPVFAEKGDFMVTRFKHDAHWSEVGHQWAAEALADYFKRNPKLLSR